MLNAKTPCGLLCADSIRVDALYDIWLKELSGQASESYCKQCASYGAARIKPVIGAKRIGKLGKNDLRRVIDTAISDGLSSKTVTSIGDCLTAFIEYAHESRLTSLEPDSVLTNGQATDVNASASTLNELKTLFTADSVTLNLRRQPDIFINAYRFEVLTGLCSGELTGLKWSDISGGKIMLKRGMSYLNKAFSDKNGSARRIFALTPLDLRVLQNQNAMLLQLGIRSEFVFPNHFGDYALSQTIDKRWARYCAEHGISHADLHELRYALISIVKALPESGLKRFIGHVRDADASVVYSQEIECGISSAADLARSIFAVFIPDGL